MSFESKIYGKVSFPFGSLKMVDTADPYVLVTRGGSSGPDEPSFCFTSLANAFIKLTGDSTVIRRQGRSYNVP